MNVIEIDGITKDYGNNKGIFDASFSVKKGEVMGFLGPNGAGKTTTIRQLMGFIKPDSGKVYINGMDCFDSASEIQKELGYLPGEIAFMDDMTGDEFIGFVAGMKGITDMSRANELMSFFDLDASGLIKKMSKGMKQKIGIVCAFMQNPNIIILDEPTSGLDPLMQNRFVELILQEKQKGTTILMSSHTFEEVEKTCDRTVIVKTGRIVNVEDMDNLRKNKQKVIEIIFENEDIAKSFSTSHEQYDAKLKGTGVEIKIKGKINSLIKELSNYNVIDLNVRAQSLEELFMHFYGGEKQ